MYADRFSNILVVEDNEAELRLLCEILEDEGFRVIGCGSAREALEHVHKQDFGVAVVDHRLPDLTGTQLLEQVHDFDDHVRVIIYTGAASYDSVKEALNLGAFAYLEKLSDRGELLRHVHRACHERVGRYALDLERAVASRTEELARSNRELETFASVVAHDLRSPLLTISGYCQLIDEEFGDQLEDRAGEYLTQVVGGAARMSHLIDDLLEYSRAGRSREPLRRVKMRDVLELVSANIESLIRTEEARIEIGDMPTVTGDQTQLVQLFQNLLSNAIKFRREEPPRIRVTAEAEDDFCRIAIEDNGIGIAPEHFDRVFQTFQRLQGREYPGTGIGLAICKKIVDRHHGKIWLESTVGSGTTFYLSLPK